VKGVGYSHTYETLSIFDRPDSETLTLQAARAEDRRECPGGYYNMEQLERRLKRKTQLAGSSPGLNEFAVCCANKPFKELKSAEAKRGKQSLLLDS
jgi:hypothetical protein